MSHSSKTSSPISNHEKEEDNVGALSQGLTPGQEELREAAEPTFIEHGDDNNNDPDLEKVQTKASTKPSVTSLSSIPNGGLTAWLQVLSGFFIFFNSWGIVNTFGTYQTYYEIGILSSSSPSAISWIGSLQGTLLLLIGSLTGPIYDAGYARSLVAAGTFLTVFGQMMLSLATTYWQVLLAQAFCIGLGTGCLFIPGVAIISQYFTTRIGTAVGLAASGSSLGGVIYPIMFHRLQPRVGFPWACRIIGFTMLTTLLISNAVMRVRVLPLGKRKLLDLSAWKEIPFTFFVLGTFIGFLGLYTPFFYIQSYAIQTGLTNENLAFYLLAILNSASVFGRIIPNFISDKIGPFNVIIPCTFATGVLCLCLIPTKSIGPVIAITALYGFTSGTFVSLPATIFVHITKNRGLIGTRMGMGFCVTAIGILTGTPITGAILDASSYTYVWLFGGSMTVAAGCLIIVARVSKGGWKLTAIV